MTRKDISDAAWKVLLRGNQAELHRALVDLLAGTVRSRIIESWREPEHIADEEAAMAGMIFTSRFFSMAAQTKISFTGGLR